MSNSTDIAIQSASMPDPKAQNALARTPIYLVSIDKNKSVEYFVAVKFEQANSFSKLTGFYTNVNKDEIIGNFMKMVNEAQAADYVEVYLPNNKIEIRSLTYRHKGK